MEPTDRTDFGETGKETLQRPHADDRFVHETGLAERVAHLADPVLASLGFRLVRVHVSGRDGRTVQIMAERPDGTMTINDCEIVSKQLSPLLDVHDVMSESYRLEVSSPGIDRPLVRWSDFEDWAGHEAKVEMKEPVEGRRKFRGRIEGFADGEVRMEVEHEKLGRVVLGLPAAWVSEARLVLTDELVREALTRAKSRNKAQGLGDGSLTQGTEDVHFDVEED